MVIPPGRSGAVTIYSAQFHENAEETPHPYYDGRLFVTTPVAAVVWDLLIPTGLSDPSTARVAVYGRRTHPQLVYEERKHDLVPQREMISYLGAHELPPPIAGSERYQEVARHVLQQRGWLGTRFDIYRSRVEYPVLHTMLVARVDAAAK
jgi:hypothetical protein